MKVSNNFSIEEYVPKAVFTQFGNRCIWFLDPKLIEVVQMLREQYGPITINNWHQAGNYEFSGFRPQWSSVGAAFSQHRFGRAADLKFNNYTVQEVYADIIDNKRTWLGRGLTTLENVDHTPTWLHVDVRPSKEFLIVNP